jgi:hypothetical protein
MPSQDFLGVIKGCLSLDCPALPPTTLFCFPFKDAAKCFTPAKSVSKQFAVAAAALTKDDAE